MCFTDVLDKNNMPMRSPRAEPPAARKPLAALPGFLGGNRHRPPVLVGSTMQACQPHEARGPVGGGGRQGAGRAAAGQVSVSSLAVLDGVQEAGSPWSRWGSWADQGVDFGVQESLAPRNENRDWSPAGSQPLAACDPPAPPTGGRGPCT